jgi:AcrR family transcriptional regulator
MRVNASPDRGGSRERIARAAIVVAARTRRRKLSVVDICEEAGVSRGTFYRHFSGSLGVESAMASAMAAAVVAELEIDVVSGRSPTPDALRGLADGLSRVFVSDTVVGDLVRNRPVLALELITVAANDIAEAVVAWLPADAVRRGRRARIDHVAALVRLALAIALAQHPGDARLLRRAAGAWLTAAGEPVAAVTRAS